MRCDSSDRHKLATACPGLRAWMVIETRSTCAPHRRESQPCEVYVMERRRCCWSSIC